MTDEARHYKAIGREFAGHESVNHGEEEYVRGVVHTNTVENFYSVFKRGMKGVYQHCSEKHLHRYVAEFDFRYSNRVALARTIWNAPKNWQRASSVSASLIGGLTKPDFKRQARRFLRWNKAQQ